MLPLPQLPAAAAAAHDDAAAEVYDVDMTDAVGATDDDSDGVAGGGGGSGLRHGRRWTRHGASEAPRRGIPTAGGIIRYVQGCEPMRPLWR